VCSSDLECGFEFEFEEIRFETLLAYLLIVDGEEIWIPKSQIIAIDKRDMQAEISLWLAEKKGWIGEEK
jgi:hypothetical protein